MEKKLKKMQDSLKEQMKSIEAYKRKESIRVQNQGDGKESIEAIKNLKAEIEAMKETQKREESKMTVY